MKREADVRRFLAELRDTYEVAAALGSGGVEDLVAFLHDLTVAWDYLENQRTLREAELFALKAKIAKSRRVRPSEV
jgi:hypothetical protein